MQATQIAKDEGMLDKKDKKANRGKSKEQIKVRFLEGNKWYYCKFQNKLIWWIIFSVLFLLSLGVIHKLS